MNRKMRAKLNNQRARAARERPTLVLSPRDHDDGTGNCKTCHSAIERHTDLTVDFGEYNVTFQNVIGPDKGELN